MRFSILIFTLFYICSCNRDLAGPTTEQGNPQIVAVIIDSLNTPVAGIPVSLLVFQQNDDTLHNEQVLPTNAIKISTAKSTSDGKCTFSNLSSGNYRIVASDSTRNLSVASKNIVLGDLIDTSFYDTLVLQKPGIIKGVVKRNGEISNQQLQNGFIQIRIRELEQFFITDPSGNYAFYNLPSGIYSIYYYAPDGFYTSRIDKVAVTPGETTIIDTVTLRPYQKLLPPANFKAVYDTATALLHFSWTAVNFQKLRYYEIQRNCDDLEVLEKKWKTLSTILTDTLLAIPDGTRFSYVIHSVDSVYTLSLNAGPIEIQVRKKGNTE
jgi:hypothetical protein